MNHLCRSPAPPAAIPAYSRHGSKGTHVAATTGHTQIDSVELQSGVGFGGDWERPQLWVILKGQGRLVHGEEGPPIPAATGRIEHFVANERRLLVAESDVTLLIIEADQFDFDGPWPEWQDPWRRIVSHQSA